MHSSSLLPLPPFTSLYSNKHNATKRRNNLKNGRKSLSNLILCKRFRIFIFLHFTLRLLHRLLLFLIKERILHQTRYQLLLSLRKLDLLNRSEQILTRNVLSPDLLHLHRPRQQREAILDRQFHYRVLQKLQNRESGAEEEAGSLHEEEIPEMRRDVDGETLREERLQPLKQKQIGANIVGLERK